MEKEKKAPYHTRQTAALVNYLSTLKGKHVTAAEISEYFRTENIPVSVTTVYRHLEKMVKEGTAVKYTVDGSECACYEYLDPSSSSEEQSLHCKCEGCGKLLHLTCDSLTEVEKQILSNHGFSVDAPRSVLYGLCAECKANK